VYADLFIKEVTLPAHPPKRGKKLTRDSYARLGHFNALDIAHFLSLTAKRFKARVRLTGRTLTG